VLMFLLVHHDTCDNVELFNLSFSSSSQNSQKPNQKKRKWSHFEMEKDCVKRPPYKSVHVVGHKMEIQLWNLWNWNLRTLQLCI
jgi:hypothetical protein